MCNMNLSHDLLTLSHDLLTLSHDLQTSVTWSTNICHMIYLQPSHDLLTLSHDLLTTITWSTYSCPSCSLWQSPDSTPWTPGSVVSPPWSGQGTWPLGDWPTLSAPGSGHPRTPHAPPASTSSFRNSILLLENRLLSKITGKNKTPPKHVNGRQSSCSIIFSHDQNVWSSLNEIIQFKHCRKTRENSPSNWWQHQSWSLLISLIYRIRAILE